MDYARTADRSPKHVFLVRSWIASILERLLHEPPEVLLTFLRCNRYELRHNWLDKSSYNCECLFLVVGQSLLYIPKSKARGDGDFR